MVDFRAKPIDPALLQQFVNAKSQTGLGTAISGLSKGMQRGMQITQQIGQAKRRKQLADTITEVKASDEFQALPDEVKGIAEIALDADPAGGAKTLLGILGKKPDKSIEEKVTEALAIKEAVSGVTTKAQVQAQESKKVAESKRNRQIAKNKLGVVFRAHKGFQEATGGAKTGIEARVRGAKEKIKAVAGKSEFVKPFEGSLVEAAAALAKLAAPSARVGEKIIKEFKKTLPSIDSTSEEVIQQLRFSLQNAFATSLGTEGIDFTQEMQTEVDSLIDEMAQELGFSTVSEIGDKGNKLNIGGVEIEIVEE